ncbi:MAG: hypothetical protein IPQ07_43680 [Myxococcales bacterium]|nr:hypothetical protein [Myxococcales bacterium]
MTEGPERIAQLAARVGWLDRYRRIVGICIGLVGALLVFAQISSDWPRMHAIGVFISVAVVIWWLSEAALAYAAAAWETECDALTSDRQLPRAIVRK